MAARTVEALSTAKCTPCEGGVEPISAEDAAQQLLALDGWELGEGGNQIEKSWKKKNFVEALQLANQIGDLAEAEGHHPDLHLTGYRHLRVVLTTHAIGGLSENDFILAAKIEQLA